MVFKPNSIYVYIKIKYNYKKYFDLSKIHSDISLLSSKFLAEGALYKGSWILSARRTYFDKFVSLYYTFQNENEPFIYYFWDIHLKGLINLNPNNQISYSQFSGKDDLSIIFGGDDFPAIDFAWDWGNSTKILSWKYLLINLLYLFLISFISGTFRDLEYRSLF